MGVTYHTGAIAEFEEAVAFYDERSEGLGRAFSVEVRSVIDQIAAHSDIGVAVRPAVRRVLLERFPYSILYNVSGDRLLILALMHHRRRPGYWADRV